MRLGPSGQAVGTESPEWRGQPIPASSPKFLKLSLDVSNFTYRAATSSSSLPCLLILYSVSSKPIILKLKIQFGFEWQQHSDTPWPARVPRGRSFAAYRLGRALQLQNLIHQKYVGQEGSQVNRGVQVVDQLRTECRLRHYQLECGQRIAGVAA